MNILIIAKHLQPGGITSYVVSLSKGLKQKGHNVFLAESGGAMEAALIESGVTVINLDLNTKSELSPKILFAVKKLLPIVREKDIQLIHAQTRVASIIAFWLAKLKGISYVTTCHGFFRARFFRRAFPFWGKKTIAISDAVFKHLIADFKLDKEKVNLIYNGLEEKDLTKVAAEEISEFKNKFRVGSGPVIGCVARLSSVKGHKFLIEAFKQVTKEFPQSQLMLVGEGSIKPQLVAQVKKLDLQSKVIFVPSVTDTILPLAVTDIFVMPSIQEGLGLAIMEAMSAGLPVIATRVGGIGTLIRDNETGILVASGEAKALSSAIIYLLKDQDKARVLGLTAQNFVRREFSLSRMLDKTEAVYNSALKI